MTLTVESQKTLTEMSPLNSSLLDEWIDFCDVRESTEKCYRKALKSFGQFLSDNNITTFDRLTRKAFIAYRNSLTATFQTSGTGRLYFTAARIFVQFLHVKGLLDGTKVLARVKPPQFDSDKRHRRDALTLQEVHEVLSACSEETEKNIRDKISIHLMACLGLRTCELSRLSVEDFQCKRGKFSLLVLGKGRTLKEEMPLPSQIAFMIMSYLQIRKQRGGDIGKKSPLLCATSNRNRNARLQEQTFSRLAKSQMRLVGIDSPSLSAHSFRHFFGTAALQATKGDTRLVMYSMRHKNQSVTERYLHDNAENPCVNLVASVVLKGVK